MNPIEAFILGTLQGITEFLPVSSSGHLALARNFFGTTGGGVTFEVILHLGTLFAVIIVFRHTLYDLLTGILNLEKESLIKLAFLAVASVPAAIIGLLFKQEIEKIFNNPEVVSILLIVTGLILWLTKFTENRQIPRETGALQAVLIGFSQALAVLPGISRSGTTISTGQFLGLNREKAAEFSFLLFIPAVIGAGFLDLFSADFSFFPPAAIISGFSASVISGYISLRIILEFVKKGKLCVFAWYCWALGLAGFIFSRTL